MLKTCLSSIPDSKSNYISWCIEVLRVNSILEGCDGKYPLYPLKNKVQKKLQGLVYQFTCSNNIEGVHC